MAESPIDTEAHPAFAVLFKLYGDLDCPGAVDPLDTDDRANMAAESVRALLHAGLLTLHIPAAVADAPVEICAAACPDLPFITCTYPAGHAPIPKEFRGLGWRNMDHGSGKHKIWWNGTTAILTEAEAI